MVAVSLAVGGFPAIFLARQKFDWHFRAFCRLADKVGIRVVRVVCVFVCVKKPFVHILVSFVCELFVGEQSCCMEDRQIAMFVSITKLRFADSHLYLILTSRRYRENDFE